MPKPNRTNRTSNPPYIIIVDTREKSPYEWPDGVAVDHKLDFGDYSIAGHEDLIAIERKTMDDFVNTVIRGWARFRRELIGLSDIIKRGGEAAIVVECDARDIINKRYTSDVHPASVFGRAAEIMRPRVSLDYVGVPVLWCGDRQCARRIVEMEFNHYWKSRKGRERESELELQRARLDSNGN